MNALCRFRSLSDTSNVDKFSSFPVRSHPPPPSLAPPPVRPPPFSPPPPALFPPSPQPVFASLPLRASQITSALGTMSLTLMDLLYTSGALIVGGIIWLVASWMHKCWKLRHFTGPPSLPLLGNLYDLKALQVRPEPALTPRVVVSHIPAPHPRLCHPRAGCADGPRLCVGASTRERKPRRRPCRCPHAYLGAQSPNPVRSFVAPTAIGRAVPSSRPALSSPLLGVPLVPPLALLSFSSPVFLSSLPSLPGHAVPRRSGRQVWQDVPILVSWVGWSGRWESR